MSNENFPIQFSNSVLNVLTLFKCCYRNSSKHEKLSSRTNIVYEQTKMKMPKLNLKLTIFLIRQGNDRGARMKIENVVFHHFFHTRDPRHSCVGYTSKAKYVSLRFLFYFSHQIRNLLHSVAWNKNISISSAIRDWVSAQVKKQHERRIIHQQPQHHHRPTNIHLCNYNISCQCKMFDEKEKGKFIVIISHFLALFFAAFPSRRP